MSENRKNKYIFVMQCQIGETEYRGSCLRKLGVRLKTFGFFLTRLFQACFLLNWGPWIVGIGVREKQGNDEA